VSLSEEELRLLDNHPIPEYILDGLRRYKYNHLRPGDFLFHALANNFVDAAGHADPFTASALQNIAVWIYNYIPRNAWGSVEAVEAWIERGNPDKT